MSLQVNIKQKVIMIKTNAKEVKINYMQASHSETNKINTNWKPTSPKPNKCLT